MGVGLCSVSKSVPPLESDSSLCSVSESVPVLYHPPHNPHGLHWIPLDSTGLHWTSLDFTI